MIAAADRRRARERTWSRGWPIQSPAEPTTTPFGSSIGRLGLVGRRSLLSSTALALFCVAVLGAPQPARAQCSTNPTNGGVLQNGGTPCTVGNVTVGFGTAIDATNSANVTANGAVTAHGFGTGISARPTPLSRSTGQ
jgi:hypothetical protein